VGGAQVRKSRDEMTERYAHLVPGYFREGVYSALQVDLSENSASVRPIGTGEPTANPIGSRESKGNAGVVL